MQMVPCYRVLVAYHFAYPPALVQVQDSLWEEERQVLQACEAVLARLERPMPAEVGSGW